MPSPLTHLDELISRYPALEPCRDSIYQGYELLLSSILGKGKILIAGNGGSAADSSHIAGELLKSFMKKRGLSPEEKDSFEAEAQDLADRLEGAIPAISLPDQGAIHSAFGNDVGAEFTFAQLVWGLGFAEDALLVISTSGNSLNLVHALRTARAKKIPTLGLLGRDGGKMLPLCDVAIVAPGANTPQIQEHHFPIYHALCIMLEEALF